MDHLQQHHVSVLQTGVPAGSGKKAKELLSYGHNVDLGIMQLNCRYQCSRPGISIDNIFDPQINIGVAKTVFMEFWVQARKVSLDFKTRIIAAVGAYNNGRVLLND